MLLLIEFEFAAVMPKLFLKLLRAIVVPTKAESYPNLCEKADLATENDPLIAHILTA